MTEKQDVYRDVLEEGFALHWYEVKSVLGRGAFGVTYLALDKNLDQLVAIKEYFPREFSSRDSGFTVHPSTGESQELFEWGLDRFIREAQTLAKFKHHNIVRVMSVFELNNTAYMVMEYEQGEELSRRYKMKKNLSEQELLNIFLPILDGLKLVHDAGFIHRDIKPANIYIRDDGSPVLIDFGAARKTIGAPTRAITSLVTHGYAPFEQYNESDEKQGAWTDIYALGACLYYAVNGKLPRDALARGSSLLASGVDSYEPVSVTRQGQFSDGFLRAIDHALMFQAPKRPQDVLLWADMLSGKVEAPPLPEEMLRQSADADDNDATVILTSPPSVPPNARPSARPSVSPASIPPSTRAHSLSERSATPSEPVVKTATGFIQSIPSGVRIAAVALSVIFVLGGIFLGFMGGDESAEGMPDTRPDKTIKNTPETIKKSTEQRTTQLNNLLKKAENARRSGQLLEKDGGAIYFYLQVLKMDPANREAKMRVEEIIELYADGIRSDLAEGFYKKAQANIKLLQAAATDSTTVFKLMQEVRSAKASRQEINQLLEQGDAEFKAGRLIAPKEKNALLIYRSVLAVSPKNPGAQKGIENIIEHFVMQAENDLAKGKVVDAERNINNIFLADKDSVQAKALLNKLKAKDKKVGQTLAQAQRALKVGNITSPRNKNALALYQRVLKLDPGNAQAKQGIKQVRSRLQSQFNQYLSAADLNSAEMLVRKIEKLMPGTRLAKNTRSKLQKKKLASRPDIEIISELLGQFKKAFESRNIKALRRMSEFQPNRLGFIKQFYKNYTSFKFQISGFKHISRKQKGSAKITLKNLVNIRGESVEPGTWSRFEIVIRKNVKGQWKVFW